MMKEDINDNEIRIIGKPKTPTRKHKWIWIPFAIALMIAVLILLFTLHHPTPPEHDPVSVFEPENTVTGPSHPLRVWACAYDSIKDISGCAIKDTVFNDIPIRVYLPLNAHAALEVGRRCLSDDKTILAFQAADIRADNQKIVGAFVEKGKPIAWGLSKKGYCAIIDDVITVGMADNSPLFEEATDKGGYFFRQYPLVSNGQPQPSELRSQTIRRALCDLDEHIVVIETLDRASMHDFGQLLADIGVTNAIYLIGSDAYGIAVDTDGHRYKMGIPVTKPYKYINYIFWQSNAH